MYLVIVRVTFDWLQSGAIPVFDLRRSDRIHQWSYLQTEPVCGWNLGQTSRSRLIVPLGETRLQALLEFLRQPLLPEEGCLVVVVRSVFNLDVGVEPIFDYPNLGRDPLLSIGAVTTSELSELPEGIDVELVEGCLPESCLQLLERFLRTYEVQEEPEHPMLRDAWRVAQAQRAASAEQTRRWNEERAQERASSERALTLLKRHLNEAQLQELEAFKGFHVVGADGRTYRIHHAAHGNVFSIEGGVPTVNYCIVAVNEVQIPIYDLMLAQKVLLESAPDSFFTTANAKDVPEDVREEMADPKVSARVLSRVVDRAFFERLLPRERDVNPEPVAP